MLPADERTKVVEKKDMYIDIGARSSRTCARQACAWAIRSSRRVEFAILANPKMYLAKAFDDRVGCARLIQALEQLGTLLTP